MTKLRNTYQPDIYYIFLDELPIKLQDKIYEEELCFFKEKYCEGQGVKISLDEINLNDKIYDLELIVTYDNYNEETEENLMLKAKDILSDDAGYLSVYLTEL